MVQADNDRYCRISIQNLQTPEAIEGTRLDAEIKALSGIQKAKQPYPTHTDLKYDQTLPSAWDQEPKIPSLFQAMLPEGVQFINHQQEYSNHAVHVQLEGWGVEAIMFRAKWSSSDGDHYSANVLSSTAPLYDNLMNAYEGHTTQKYLAGTKGRPVFIHVGGGGTRAVTPASAFEKAIVMGHYGVDVLSISHPLHGEGPQQMMSVRKFWYMMNDFVMHYVHPNAEIYIGGHSLGGSLTATLMEMWDRERTENPSFFPNLKGLLIASPAMDPAPGRPISEKIERFLKQEHSARELSETESPDGNLWAAELIREGKLGILEEIWTIMSLLQQDQYYPENKGRNYPPAFVVTAKKDPLVSLTPERRGLSLYYFRYLENVKLFYLIKKRQLIVPVPRQLAEPGHILGDFQYRTDEEIAQRSHAQKDEHPKPDIPIDTHIALQLIAHVSGKSLSESAKAQQDYAYSRNDIVWILTKMAQQSSNDIAFRNWLETFETRLVEPIDLETTKLHEQMEKIGKQASALITRHFPYNLFASEIKLLSNVQTSEELTSSLERLERLRSFIEGHPSLKRYKDDFKDIDNLETARHTARDIAKRLFLKSSIYDGISREDVQNMFSSGSREELSNFFNHFPYPTNSRQPFLMLNPTPYLFPYSPPHQTFFIPDSVRKEVLYLYDSFQTFTHEKAKGNNIRKARQYIGQYHPYVILYKTLEMLSKKPLPSQLTEYFPSLQIFSDYFSTIDHYKPLAQLLEKLLSASNNEEILSVSQEIINLYASVGPLSTRSHELQHISINRNTTQEDFFNILRPFQFPEKDQIQMWEQDIQPIIEEFKRTQDSKEEFISPLIVKKAPANRLDQLISLLREITVHNTLRELKEYFTLYEPKQQFIEVINQLLESPSPEQSMRIAYAFMEAYYFQWIYNQHKDITKISHAFHNKQKASNLRLLENSPYLDKTRQDIQDYYHQYHKIEQFIDGFHVPSLKDFYDYRDVPQTPENDQRFSKSIETIRNNTKQKKQARARLQKLLNDRDKLSDSIRVLTNTVKSHIRTVKQVLSQSHTQPPASLEDLYRPINEDIVNPLLKLSEQRLADRLITFGEPFLENLGFLNNKNVIKAMNSDSELQSMIREYESLQAQWKDAERSLHPHILKAMLEGEMGEEGKIAVVALYGPTGEAFVKDSSYRQLENQLSQLAQIESDIIKTQEQLSRLQLEYHRIYPAPMVSTSLSIQPMEILNFDGNESIKSHINRQRKEIETMYKIWSNMRSVLPPPLPMDPLTSSR